MVAAKVSVGQFGGVLRRILYTLCEIDTLDVARAQAITEYATQKVLSVKAGKRPMDFWKFNQCVFELTQGRCTFPPDDTDLADVLSGVRGEAWAALARRMPQAGTTIDWLEFLRKPHELANWIRTAPAGELRLPLYDARVWPFWV
jgi:hypothetical protein